MSAQTKPQKIAIVLFNLGGPDNLAAVRPFLRNLFLDPAIIGAPGPIRWLLAEFISRRREKPAQENYAKMGGRSPLLPETEKQAQALLEVLKQAPMLKGAQISVHIAMRYWHPFVEEVAAAVRAENPDKVILLPLYPQFSTTTTGSSLKAWRKAFGPHNGAVTICCYPNDGLFAQAHAQKVLESWEKAGKPATPRILWSAHGLPQKIIDAGDPYQTQVEESVAAVAALLPADFEHVICYQSRVGPLKWIGPSTDAEIARAGAEQRGVFVVPIAFVSEHIETLVELDDEYRHLATEKSVPYYHRVAALGDSVAYVESLAAQVLAALGQNKNVVSGRQKPCGNAQTCPACPLVGAQ